MFDPVAVAVDGISVAAIGSAISASYMIATGVRGIIQNRLSTACCQIAAARQRAATWLAVQQQQALEMSFLRQAEEMLLQAEQRLAALTLGGVRQLATETAGGPPPAKHRYLGLGRKQKVSREEILALLKDIAATVEAFPAELRAVAGSPVENLRGQVAHILQRCEAGDEISQREALSFKGMVSATLTSYLKEVEAERKLKEELQKRAEAAFDEILVYQELAYEMRPQYDAMNVLRDQLINLFESGEFKLDRMEVVEKRLKTIKEEVDKKVLLQSYRQGISESVTRNLSDMGYQTLQAFPSGEEGMIKAVMRMPGGERVEVAIHANSQVGFQFQHERYSESGDLTPAEMTHMRNQEKRWCQDLKELVRRMVAEGFDYKLSFEKEIPEESIKVVVVETPEEVEEEGRAADKKYLRRE
jgi:hypothetical protein